MGGTSATGKIFIKSSKREKLRQMAAFFGTVQAIKKTATVHGHEAEKSLVMSNIAQYRVKGEKE